MAEEDKLCSDFEAAYRIGDKVIEMSERVLVAHKCAPGASAAWGFTLDGTRFEVTVKVGKPTDG